MLCSSHVTYNPAYVLVKDCIGLTVKNNVALSAGNAEKGLSGNELINCKSCKHFEL